MLLGAIIKAPRKNSFLNFVFRLLSKLYRVTIEFYIFTFILHPSSNCLLVLIILWWMSQDFLYTRLSHLQREIVLCLPFRSGCLVFPFLPNFLDKSFHSTLNRSGENKLPFHFLDLGEEAIQFSTINSGVSYGFSVDALYHTEKVFFCS